MVVADAFAGFVILGALAGLYFLPWIVANHRKVPNEGSIAILNLFLGWTLVGWVVALAMAARSLPRSVTTDQTGVSPQVSESTTSVSAQSDTPPSTVSELERLAELKERGVLSDEEFQRAKDRTLNERG
jgi:hypothetical protein